MDNQEGRPNQTRLAFSIQNQAIAGRHLEPMVMNRNNYVVVRAFPGCPCSEPVVDSLLGLVFQSIQEITGDNVGSMEVTWGTGALANHSYRDCDDGGFQFPKSRANTNAWGCQCGERLSADTDLGADETMSVLRAYFGWHYLSNATCLIRPRLFSTAPLV